MRLITTGIAGAAPESLPSTNVVTWSTRTLGKMDVRTLQNGETGVPSDGAPVSRSLNCLRAMFESRFYRLTGPVPVPANGTPSTVRPVSSNS